MKICIDAGHYANCNKGIAPDYYEGNAMLTLARYLKKALESYGAQVYMTRTDGNDLSLDARGALAVQNDCELFLSLHSDANSSNENARGVTVIRSLQRPDSVSLGKKLVETICDVMGAPMSTYAGADDGVWTRAYPNTTATDYYGVLRAAAKGACVQDVFLVEHSFHTNALDCAFLADEDCLEWLANAEASTIATHYGLIGTSAIPPCYLTMGYASVGDVTYLTSILEALRIPYTGAAGYLATDVPVSGKDLLELRAQCSALGIACICETQEERATAEDAQAETQPELPLVPTPDETVLPEQTEPPETPPNDNVQNVFTEIAAALEVLETQQKAIAHSATPKIRKLLTQCIWLLRKTCRMLSKTM